MFLPRGIGKSLTPLSLSGKLVLALGFAGLVMSGTFLLRSYTVSHLTLWTKAKNVVALSILPEDGFKMEHRMESILDLEEVKERMQDNKKYLVYFLPRDYIMQGMIADTGGDWKLYRRHHTAAMITDWVFHPFRHLREGHHAMHSGMHMPDGNNAGIEGGVIRRLIFLSIEDIEIRTPADLFAINALRMPQFMVDVDVHTMQLLDVKDLAHGSGWGTVPTPIF